MDLSRTIILGNAGAGKSWLAERIARRLGTPCIDLDVLHWLPGGYNARRDREEAIEMLRQATVGDRWVVEGIYGDLINEIQSDATVMIWLCLDEAECVTNIRQRGIRRGGTDESFAALLNWASSYQRRNGSSSYEGHAAVFKKYNGEKTMIRSRDAVGGFAERFA